MMEDDQHSPPQPLGAGEVTIGDSELMQRVANGDRIAFDQLLRRYYRKVYATCFRLLSSPEEAEDATQDVFLKVYRAADSFRPELRFSTWLYRISVNHCLNVLRWKRRRRWLSLSALVPLSKGSSDTQELETMLASDPSAGPDQHIEKKERAEAVRRAIQSLPEQQRIAVILHRYDGLSYQEIAEVMGTSVSSVESRLHRAKLALAKKLTEYLEIGSETPAVRQGSVRGPRRR